MVAKGALMLNFKSMVNFADYLAFVLYCVSFPLKNVPVANIRTW